MYSATFDDQIADIQFRAYSNILYNYIASELTVDSHILANDIFTVGNTR